MEIQKFRSCADANGATAWEQGAIAVITEQNDQDP
jgi:hypothetical protein